jgi:hypothetical protein
MSTCIEEFISVNLFNDAASNSDSLASGDSMSMNT